MIKYILTLILMLTASVAAAEHYGFHYNRGHHYRHDHYYQRHCPPPRYCPYHDYQPYYGYGWYYEQRRPEPRERYRRGGYYGFYFSK